MSTASIPRFLLPQRGLVWQRQQQQLQQLQLIARSTARYASNKSNATPSKKAQLVLEKPTKFVPPSHPARLRKTTRSYPGPRLTPEQEQAQQTKQYPNMMPPEGSFLHWFLNSRSIHVWITMGFLTSLAMFTFVTNFKQTSDFADMLPPTSSVFTHPIAFCRTWIEVWKLERAKEDARIAHNRKLMTDDVVKRDDYRIAHGLNTEGFGGWTAKREEPKMPESQVLPSIPGTIAMSKNQSPVLPEEAGAEISEPVEHKRKPIKKWFGIW